MIPGLYKKLDGLVPKAVTLNAKNGYKLLFFGTHIQYGVGIAILEGFHDTMEEVKRFDDRPMKLTIISADR